MGGSNYCSVPGCRRLRKKVKTENKRFSLFVPPRNGDLFEKWKKAMPPNFELTRKHKICISHFDENDIERHYVTLLKDGSVSKIERGKIKLRSGAVPSIFFNLEMSDERKQCTVQSDKQYSSENRITINDAVENNELIPGAVDMTILKSEDVSNTTDVSENTSHFPFQEFIRNIRKVEIPNELWGLTVTQNFVIFSRWTKEYEVIKKVIIESDLNVKIFLQDEEVQITVSDTDDFIHEIERILKAVESL